MTGDCLAAGEGNDNMARSRKIEDTMPVSIQDLLKTMRRHRHTSPKYQQAAFSLKCEVKYLKEDNEITSSQLDYLKREYGERCLKKPESNPPERSK